MAFIYYNSNPYGKVTDDNVVKAISVLLKADWEDIYAELAIRGLENGDTMTSPRTYIGLLNDNGFRLCRIDEISVRDFARKNNDGRYLVQVNNYLIPIIDGDYYDVLDVGNETVYLYWRAL